MFGSRKRILEDWDGDWLSMIFDFGTAEEECDIFDTEHVFDNEQEIDNGSINDDGIVYRHSSPAL
jgi:hypothetical protein